MRIHKKHLRIGAGLAVSTITRRTGSSNRQGSTRGSRDFGLGEGFSRGGGARDGEKDKAGGIMDEDLGGSRDEASGGTRVDLSLRELSDRGSRRLHRCSDRQRRHEFTEACLQLSLRRSILGILLEQSIFICVWPERYSAICFGCGGET